MVGSGMLCMNGMSARRRSFGGAQRGAPLGTGCSLDSDSDSGLLGVRPKRLPPASQHRVPKGQRSPNTSVRITGFRDGSQEMPGARVETR